MTTAAPLLRVEGVSVHFPVRRGVLQRQVGAVRAVEQVTLTLDAEAGNPWPCWTLEMKDTFFG